MWKKIKDLFKDKQAEKFWQESQQKAEQLSEILARVSQELEDQKRLLEKRTEELDALRAKENEREQRQNSKDPWVSLTSAEFKPEDGFRIELDWNPAFIKQLKESGIDGPNDEIIIQKWLAFLYEDVVTRLEQQQQEAKEQNKTISDFT